MAFLQITSYLYGMYLLCHPLSSDHRILTDSVKRMLNALQSMLSILISVKEHGTHLVRNRVKLFLTTAHFCKKNVVVNDSDTSKTTKLKPIDLLLNDEVLAVLHSLHVTSSYGDNPKSTLDKIKRSSLEKELQQRGLKSIGKNKNDLQICLFNDIVDRTVAMPDQTTNNSGDNVIHPKSCVWGKGAWISIVTNIDWQIDLLGPLIWIW